jgi:ATP-dependent Zn protease
MDRAYQRAKSILKERRDDLTLVATTLLQKETLERGELEQLLAIAKPELTPQH